MLTLCSSVRRGKEVGREFAAGMMAVFKVASNSPIFERMRDDLDLNAGTILDGRETVAEVGRRIFTAMVEIASGAKMALAEEWRHVEFQIWADDAVSL